MSQSGGATSAFIENQMRLFNQTVILSATDLANHLSCRHLTQLNLLLAKKEVPAPSWDNPHLSVLQQRGLEHEHAYVDTLRSKGVNVLDLSGRAEQEAATSTCDAMQRGDPVIVQAVLGEGDWRGRADVLLRVNNGRASRFGNWSYEAVDCKLASETKAETILQLCVYSELIGSLQGLEPEFFHVIRPETGFAPESYRLTSFAAYYRLVKKALQNAVTSRQDSYPEPVAHCEICPWWKECDRQRRQDDHLSLVAGASRLQRKELVSRGVTTLGALAKLPLPIPFKPYRGARDSYVRIREQARIQKESRDEARLKFELLDSVEEEGLYRLPAPSKGDIFLDFEGDPFVEGGGLEYLFGVLMSEEGRLVYQSRWAGDRSSERAAFEWLIDVVFERMARFPDLHIYHFGVYEPGAVKRLVLRYATREEEVDRLLRGEVFVDLHAITRQSLRASVEQYSLKEMEKFGDYQRRVPLPEANQARHFVEHQLELQRSLLLTGTIRTLVEGYNEDDCRATERHRQWLENLRSELMARGEAIARPAPKDAVPSEKLSAHTQRVARLFDALTRDLPAEPKDRFQARAARWLLAHALDWHRREEKVKWWEYYRMRELPEEELYDEKAAVVGLSHRQRMPKGSPKERAPVDQYTYPSQEYAIREGDTLYSQNGEKFGDVVATDTVARTVDVKKPIKLDAFHPTAAFAHSRYPTKEQSESILRCAEWIVAYGIEGRGDYQAARDLLLRVPPRLNAGKLCREGDETVVHTACRAALALDNSVLPIQGPPGAGKTYTGARMICALVNEGKKVGVTAVSHKVIRRLLDEVAEAAREMHIAAVQCGHRKDNVDAESWPVREIGTNCEALKALQSGAVNVLGATSWLWCREEFRDSLHCLFVDEAGQMALANALACAPAGANLVLLGDPQQLEQPQKGSHPEGSDISALAHLLGGGRTIGEGQGLFLAETWRLHPSICRFTSELFYEQRLVSVDGLQRQSITVPSLLSGAGLWFAAVVHDGNRSHSAEEIEHVSRIMAELTRPGSTWTDSKGTVRPLTMDDILVVAPYNDQVNRLMERLQGARVGTVDKFQGQQAAVVIYSMTTSTPEDAPRGMEFLYDPNRFNVATSRARCACIVVGSPRLFSPECRTPRQMELANVLCRYAEMSNVVEIALGNRA
jgi:predicted RecB family nuclease